MNFAFASSHALATPIALSLKELEGFSGFISNPDMPYGRSKELRPNTFVQSINSFKDSIFKPADSEELSKILIEKKLDLVVTCAYGKLIPATILELPKYGWLNVHFSKLPALRGAAPVQRGILEGRQKFGYSIFKMEKGLDTGPIAATKEIVFNENEKCSEILNLLALESIPDTVRIIENIASQKFTPQAEIGASYAKKISRADRKIDLSNTADAEFNRYRAMDINGGVFLLFREQEMGVTITGVSNKKLARGAFLLEDGFLYIGCKSESLTISKIKPAGKREMEVKAWFNGVRTTAGDVFE